MMDYRFKNSTFLLIPMPNQIIIVCQKSGEYALEIIILDSYWKKNASCCLTLNQGVKCSQPFMFVRYKKKHYRFEAVKYFSGAIWSIYNQVLFMK